MTWPDKPYISAPVSLDQRSYELRWPLWESIIASEVTFSELGGLFGQPSFVKRYPVFRQTKYTTQI